MSLLRKVKKEDLTPSHQDTNLHKVLYSITLKLLNFFWFGVEKTVFGVESII